MTNTEIEAHLKDQSSSLISFIPIFTHPDFIFGTEILAFQDKEGYWVPGHYRYGPDVYRFLEVCRGTGFINSTLMNGSVVSDTRFRELRHNPEAVALITITEAATLLTFLSRQERFAHGILADAFKDGTIISILYRIEQLRRQKNH